jgi:NAD+ synthase (glutamine-hydrolysing)
MMSTFYSPYSHDFIRVASGVPRMRVADVPANLAETIRLARQGDALKADLMIFPELGLSPYAIDDLLFRDALLDSVEEAIGQLVELPRGLYRPDKFVEVECATANPCGHCHRILQSDKTLTWEDRS